MIDYKQHIAQLIKELYPSIGDVAVVIPPKEELGDFSVGTFTLNIDGVRNPVEKAKMIKSAIDEKHDKCISRVEVAGPYLNFYIDKTSMAASVMEEILMKKEGYGSRNQGNSEPLLIEHTSINPNASPHIGRARNSIIGNFLTRLFHSCTFYQEIQHLVIFLFVMLVTINT